MARIWRRTDPPIKKLSNTYSRTNNKSTSRKAYVSKRREPLPQTQLTNEPLALPTFAEIMTSNEPHQFREDGNIPKLLDCSDINPTTWDEVRSLQDALQPSREQFTRFTGRPSPLTKLWSSYNLQLDELQSCLNALAPRRSRGVKAPLLVGRGPWTGGIQNWRMAKTNDALELRVSAQSLEAPNPRSISHAGQGGTSGSEHSYTGKGLQIELVIDPESGRSRIDHVSNGKGRQKKPISKVVHRIVSAHPSGFMEWVAHRGPTSYRRYLRTHERISWEEYYRWIAPFDYQLKRYVMRRYDQIDDRVQAIQAKVAKHFRKWHMA
ncbi:hypothetical protein MMC24_005877 [Lignoscripta atroalba]|nr:hypothetical protein [Lignoscripta atroalba]